MSKPFNQELYAYLLKIISIRDYTEFELKQKSDTAGYESQEFESVLSILKTSKFVSDERIIENYIYQYQGYKGKKWLKQKLTQRGFKANLVEKTISEFQEFLNPTFKEQIEQKAKQKQESFRIKKLAGKKNITPQELQKIDYDTKLKYYHNVYTNLLALGYTNVSLLAKNF